MTSTTTPTRAAGTTVAIDALLASRWSPRAFASTEVGEEDLRGVLEAARWAPSANNYQPWRFLVGQAGADGADSTYKGIFDALAEFNQVWASAAPVLVAGITEVEHEDGSPREIGPYELGLAVAQLSIEATARGLHVHQLGGFDADQVSATFDVPPQYRTVVVLAIGHLGDVESLPGWAAERETAPRERKPLADIAFAETFGTPLSL